MFRNVYTVYLHNHWQYKRKCLYKFCKMPSPRLTTLHVFIDETHLDKITGPLGISIIKKGLYRGGWVTRKLFHDYCNLVYNEECMSYDENSSTDKSWPAFKELSCHSLFRQRYYLGLNSGCYACHPPYLGHFNKSVIQITFHPPIGWRNWKIK